MFKKDYQDSLKNITPDKYIKQKIQNRLSYEQSLMEKRENEKAKRNPAVYWRLGFTAVVCCVAIVLGIVLIPKSPAADKSQLPQKQSDKEYTKNGETLTAFNGYDDIFSVIKASQNFYQLYTEATKGDDFSSDGLTSGSVTDDSSPSQGSSAGGGGNSLPGADLSESPDYSSTNTQVENVDESDVVKTDGKYIYTIYNGIFSILRPQSDDSPIKLLSKLDCTKFSITGTTYAQMYIYKNRAIIVDTYEGDMLIIDTTDISNPTAVTTVRPSGGYLSSRLIGSKLYVVYNVFFFNENFDKNKPETFVPTIEIGGSLYTCDYKNIYSCPDNYMSTRCAYLSVCCYEVTDGALDSFTSVIGSADNVYCNTENLIAATSKNNVSDGDKSETLVSRFSISKGKIKYETSAIIDGTLLNQFSIDEHNGYFRFVTTVKHWKTVHIDAEGDNEPTSYKALTGTSNGLVILNKDLYTVGEISSLAEGEKVYSVRFMGDMAYFVTYRQIDPLFSADLSDPENPKILGALKIPGFSSYLHPYGDKLLGIGRIGGTVKLSMFDISDPENVIEESVKHIYRCLGSEALDNHKSVLIDYKKNFIGFPAHKEVYCYKLYSYDESDSAFKHISQIRVGYEEYSLGIRGIYIGDYFHLISHDRIRICHLEKFSTLTTTYY